MLADNFTFRNALFMCFNMKRFTMVPLSLISLEIFQKVSQHDHERHMIQEDQETTHDHETMRTTR